MADDRERISPVDEAKLLRAAACDWRLSRGDCGVFSIILKHCDGAWLAWPGTRTIADQARLAASNVAASLERLERFRYLQVIRRGQRKRQDYQVLESPPVPASAPARKSSGFGRSAPARKSSSESSSAPVDVCSSAPVGKKDLLLWAGTEGSSEITLEDTGALISFEEQQQQRQLERRAQIRSQYLRARESDPVLVKLMERDQVYRKHIEDLIGDGANRGSSGEALDAAA